MTIEQFFPQSDENNGSIDRILAHSVPKTASYPFPGTRSPSGLTFPPACGAALKLRIIPSAAPCQLNLRLAMLERKSSTRLRPPSPMGRRMPVVGTDCRNNLSAPPSPLLPLSPRATSLDMSSPDANRRSTRGGNS